MSRAFKLDRLVSASTMHGQWLPICLTRMSLRYRLMAKIRSVRGSACPAISVTSWQGGPPQGVIRVSDNLLDLIGRIKLLAAPQVAGQCWVWQSGTKTNQFVAGTLIETIAMGLMATIFSTILAIPVSFLAAHNIMSRLPGGTALYYIMRGILTQCAPSTRLYGVLSLLPG